MNGRPEGENAGISKPIEIETFTISMLWHARQDWDPGHIWLREAVKSIIRLKARATRSAFETYTAGPRTEPGVHRFASTWSRTMATWIHPAASGGFPAR